MLAAHLGPALDGLAIGYLRLLQVDGNLELVHQLVHDDVQMLIADTVQKLLLHLAVDNQTNRGILFHNLGQTGGYLVFVAFVLGRNGHAHQRNGKFHCRIFNRITLQGQGIAGSRHIQLADGSDIAGMQLGYFQLLLAPHNIQTAQALFGFFIYIDNRIILLQAAGHHLKIRNLAEERVNGRLEYITGELAGIAAGYLDAPVPSRPLPPPWDEAVPHSGNTA